MACHPPSRAACHWLRRILRAEGQCAQMLPDETFATPFADALRACHTSHSNTLMLSTNGLPRLSLK
jgi:hypothetical protein